MIRAGRSYAMDRTYCAAIELLRGRLRPARPTVAPGAFADMSRIPDSHGKPTVKGTPSLVGMKEWLLQIGHSVADIDDLNIIHVAGTKGKGSTCAFAEAMLSAYGRRTGFPRRTGMYSSPHLVSHDERIRLDQRSIGKDLFAKYFFEVWEMLQSKQEEGGKQPPLPRYLQLLALVAFHAFLREGVEAAVVETHHGGEYDATNVIGRPVATVVTPLGMDHATQLGPTIENIAWHKAGIFKTGVRAFSAVQDASPAEVLRRRAAAKDADISFVGGEDESLPKEAPHLMPDVQRANCSLGLAAARYLLEQKAPTQLGPLLASDVENGVQQFHWPGRFQVASQGRCQWFLDGAHNEMSVARAAEWFIQRTKGVPNDTINVLIFNQISNERDGTHVFEQLAQSFKDHHIHHVIVPNYDQHQEFLCNLGRFLREHQHMAKALNNQNWFNSIDTGADKYGGDNM